MKKIELLMSALVLTFLVGCHNPADDVAEAKTSEPAKNTPAAPDPAAAASAKVYNFTPESKIGFIGSKVTGSHEGGFKKFEGKLLAADGKLLPNQAIVIDMTSLWADSDKLAGHLKNKDFFEVEKFPMSTFKTTAIEKTDKGHTVTGDLTLHGVTKTISFPADIEVTDEAVTVKAEFFIKRFDFDVKYAGRADDLIRDEVVIKLDLQAKAG